MDRGERFSLQMEEAKLLLSPRNASYTFPIHLGNLHANPSLLQIINGSSPLPTKPLGRKPSSSILRWYPRRVEGDRVPVERLMEAAKVKDMEAQAQVEPLLDDNQDRQSSLQQAISQTFKSAAHLANLLPTGTVLAFQILSPIFTNQGQCDAVSRTMAGGLLALCGMSCLLLSFTDSFRDAKGNVRYGLATTKGLWVIDGTAGPPPEEAAAYKIKFIDFMHAFMSLSVFTAVALFDQNVVSCFYPIPSKQTEEVLSSLPVGIGVISSMLFVVFPTTRHGIGFPLSSK